MTDIAQAANAPEVWDRLWTNEGPASWRGSAMVNVYSRIAEVAPSSRRVIDLGGGVGQLADVLVEAGIDVVVCDHSRAALDMAASRGHTVSPTRAEDFGPNGDDDVIVGTEILEHLAAEDRDRLLRQCSANVGLWSVPNNCLGPDEEPQHTIKWTAKGFLDYMRGFYEHVRVECIDSYLLAVCGVDKGFTLSACTPACDEADDLERVLKSFRGVADDLVVGIDPRSADRSEEIARQYADTVFMLESPKDPPAEDPLYADDVPVEKVHFSWIRNQCMDRCTGGWIFMTEAHESLATGVDELLTFAPSVPEHVGVIFVVRSGQGMEWMFPWLTRNDSRIRYRRGTHNAVTFPPGVDRMSLRTVRTLHDRSQNNAIARNKQRKVQNRKSLHEDWRANDNANSLFYLGQEWRSFDPPKAIRYFQKFLATELKTGGIRYQARLMLSKLHAKLGQWEEAREVLLPATGDDWQRTEHWFWLGDIAFEKGQHEQALALYQLAASRWPLKPLSMFWYDVSSYTYLLAQRMTMAYAATGDLGAALLWSNQVIETLPPEMEKLKPEAEAIRDQIEEKVNGPQDQD